MKSNSGKPLENVLTPELTFGDDETIPDKEFLLARPIAISVNSTGDIAVSDENRLKIYDGEGIGIADRKVCQYFSVERNVRSFHGIDQPAVGCAIHSCCCVDADDPQLP